jgi:hypothetical protein
VSTVDIDIDFLERKFHMRDWHLLLRAAAGVANAIHVGAGGMIKGSMMEDEFRKALGLQNGQLIVIPKGSL